MISLTKNDFYQQPYYPAVLFLARFPVTVPIVFAQLVAKHHLTLYAPSDDDDQSDFFRALAVPLALAPEATGAATSDTTMAWVSKRARYHLH